MFKNVRKQPSVNRKKYREYLKADDYVTSEVREIKGVKTGAKIVWITLIISAVLLITIAVFTLLLAALFVLPESRQDILGMLERLIVELWKLL